MPSLSPVESPRGPRRRAASRTPPKRRNPVSPQYTDMHLDALREVANIGSGNAATALAGMLGRPVDLTVPSAAALPLADAVEAAGDPTTPVSAVVLPVFGEMDALVLLLFTPEHAQAL